MLGMRKHDAAVLVCFLKGKMLTQPDVEHATGIRQPEAWHALNNLIIFGFVKRERLDRATQGHPLYGFTLAKKLSDIYLDISGPYRDAMSFISHEFQISKRWE
jgi:predicted transcriptional regulator